ncbi:hypothetical protein SK128_014796 [Halocaridina rubra]|uniref:Uncharacterized protein n=1 Tax=Halocaridina rubra TaxID=373956 RepID=A0AAN9A691_HALRR
MKKFLSCYPRHMQGIGHIEWNLQKVKHCIICDQAGGILPFELFFFPKMIGRDNPALCHNYLERGNEKNISFLRDIALTIIQSSSWEAGMKKISEDDLGNRITPFRRMIEKMPRVAEEVLNRCIKTDSKLGELDCFDHALSFEYLDDTYQSSVQGVCQYDANGNLMDEASRYSSDARRIKKNHPLMLMIKHKRIGLLSHPVCVALIKHKWTKFGSTIRIKKCLGSFNFVLAPEWLAIWCTGHPATKRARGSHLRRS